MSMRQVITEKALICCLTLTYRISHYGIVLAPWKSALKSVLKLNLLLCQGQY